jgi:hypothetical protein
MKSTVSKAAQLIRKDLKAAFPTVKFSVTSKNYTGGDSIRVSYIDGPKIDEIREVVNKYELGHFNGMEDIYEYSNKNPKIPQTKHVFVDRDMSDKTRAALARIVEERYSGIDGEIDDNKYYEKMRMYGREILYREFRELSMSK